MSKFESFTLVSPHASTDPGQGHFFTWNRRFGDWALHRNVQFQVISSQQNELGAGFREIREDSQGNYLLSPRGLELAEKESNFLIYEGSLRFIRLLCEINANTGKCWFNFLSSHEFVKLWLYNKLSGGKSLLNLKAMLKILQSRGVIFSADTPELARRLSRLLVPIDRHFPGMSAYEIDINFGTLGGTLGYMNPTDFDLRKLLIFTKLQKALLKSPLQITAIVTSQSNRGLVERLKLKGVRIEQEPLSGTEYVSALQCQTWIIDSRRTHHIFGSSGKFLDILNGNARIITYRYTAMHGQAAQSENNKRSIFPLLTFLLEHYRRESNSFIAPPKKYNCEFTMENLINGFEKQETPSPAIAEYENALLEIQKFNDWSNNKFFNFVLRLFYKLPRVILWNLTKL